MVFFIDLLLLLSESN